MQLIPKGPDVPERLLQAHEDGQVVFFCGAGISFPAGLPGFAGLVSGIYDALGEPPEPPERTAIKNGQYDIAIALLEQRLQQGRRLVREQLATILTPANTGRNRLATHSALLTLSKDRNGACRLVTTNFDRLFEIAKQSASHEIKLDQAPFLPVPKARWNSLVYLHGLLPDGAEPSAMEELIVSSGDFGRAYLTEGWAARFVSELFRNYVVCFVGYSINDPVMRYMVDALAADRLLGEKPLEVFAFGEFSKGREAGAEMEWRSKNVTPILYRAHSRHYFLHKTLQEWAALYREGTLGKERIIENYARTTPQTTIPGDAFVGRVVWALSDLTGAPAKRFAGFNPRPSLDWLDVLCEMNLQSHDLPRFGVHPSENLGDGVKFSVLKRPAPAKYAHPMALVSEAQTTFPQLDPVMRHLAGWLCKHLDDERLILWIAREGGALHPHFRRMIADEMERKRGDVAKSPLSPIMRKLWYLTLAGRLQSGASNLWVPDWLHMLTSEGLSFPIRTMLISALCPRVILRRRFPYSVENAEPESPPSQVRDIVDWEITLSAPDVRAWLDSHQKSQAWQAALPNLLEDFTALLRQALDLMRELDGADDQEDRSFMHMPSISNHPQNKGYREWTVLIELVRDSWIAKSKQDVKAARAMVQHWLKTPYPTFKRLAFFALAHRAIFGPDESVSALLMDKGWWLWWTETTREVMRLIVSLAPVLDGRELTAVEAAFLDGPPRNMFRDDLGEKRFKDIVDRESWLRLEKLARSGGRLSPVAMQRLHDLSKLHPEWRLSDNEREEFHIWMGEVTDLRTTVSIPADVDGIVKFLMQRPEADIWSGDDWEDRCKKDFESTSAALFQLSAEGNWLPSRWRAALHAWSDKELIEKAWDPVVDTVLKAPDDFIVETAHALGWWLERASQHFIDDPSHFFELATRLVRMTCKDEPGDTTDRIGAAINHPLGHATEAVLHRWYMRKPKDGDGLPEDIDRFFSVICNLGECRVSHGRLLLARNLISLFRVDQIWTHRNLLPFLSWERDPQEASATWQGFLWAPRHYGPLLVEIRSEFLATASHWSDLGELGEQYASLLAFEALQPEPTLSPAEIHTATHALPPEGLSAVADTLFRTLESTAPEAKAAYWEKRIAPFLKSYWPKSAAVQTPRSSEHFARLCTAAGNAFPEAVRLLLPFLKPLGRPYILLNRLRVSGHCSANPREALDLMNAVTAPSVLEANDELSDCLTEILEADPSLEQDPTFGALLEQSRR